MYLCIVGVNSVQFRELHPDNALRCLHYIVNCDIQWQLALIL